MTKEQPKKPTTVTTYPALIGAVIAKKRKENGHSQKELAEAANVGISTWSRIENGETALTIEQLVLLAQYLKMKPSALLAEVDEAVDSLQKQGITTNPERVEIATMIAAGAIPVVGLVLGAMVGAMLCSDRDKEKR